MARNQAALAQIRSIDEEGSFDRRAPAVSVYLADASRTIENIRVALAEKDVAGLIFHAHVLRVASVSLGVTRVAETAAELASSAESKAINVCPLFLTILTAEYAAAERRLKAELVALEPELQS